jgi:hypothetical protein
MLVPRHPGAAARHVTSLVKALDIHAHFSGRITDRAGGRGWLIRLFHNAHASFKAPRWSVQGGSIHGHVQPVGLLTRGHLDAAPATVS